MQLGIPWWSSIEREREREPRVSGGENVTTMSRESCGRTNLSEITTSRFVNGVFRTRLSLITRAPGEISNNTVISREILAKGQIGHQDDERGLLAPAREV
jgi:hypothetical protein